MSLLLTTFFSSISIHQWIQIPVLRWLFDEHKTHFHWVFMVFWSVLRDKCFKPLQINIRRSSTCKRRQISKEILRKCVDGSWIKHKNVIFEDFRAKNGHFVISTMVKIFYEHANFSLVYLKVIYLFQANYHYFIDTLLAGWSVWRLAAMTGGLFIQWTDQKLCEKTVES